MRKEVIALIVLLVFIVGVPILIFFNSKDDISHRQYRVKDRCVEFVYKSNGWDEHLIGIKDC